MNWVITESVSPTTHVLHSRVGEGKLHGLYVLRWFGAILILRPVEQASEDLLKEHYIDLKDRPFFAGLVKYMHSGPVVAMVSVPVNIIHGSDSVESAEKEIGLWFHPEELVDYMSCAQNWIYE
ncbi:PREDICTED: nucleoside diphosphate kinase A-like [Colobus angolensis palliatus]|uniref:nucleoside diphosphate kinase A-like n=1 Tax=Colobus angolensis palliatus TaxID=336983 RepID=UPI0005F3B722|nr:PREDICTED: nucleoside diphosphate kinase A-like [Colobus angolensis palliatus]